MTPFLQQGHTYSNQATPPNSAIPYELREPITFKLPQLVTKEDKAGSRAAGGRGNGVAAAATAEWRALRQLGAWYLE